MPIAPTPAPARPPVAPTPARPPAAPVPPVTTPTSPPPARPMGRRGRMTFRVQRLPEPLLLDQDTIDPRYNEFRSWTMIIAIIGVLASLLGGGILLGWWLNYTPSTAPAPPYSAPAPSAVSTPVAPPVQLQQDSQPQWSSYADCQRHYVLTLHQDPEGDCDSLK